MSICLSVYPSVNQPIYYDREARATVLGKLRLKRTIKRASEGACFAFTRKRERADRGGRATARPDLSRRVDVGAPVQQQPRDLDVTFFRHDVEDRPTVLDRQKGCGQTRLRNTFNRRESDVSIYLSVYLSVNQPIYYDRGARATVLGKLRWKQTIRVLRVIQ